MTWAPTQVQKTIYQTLTGDATLVGLLGGSKVYDHVPDNEDFPFIHLQIKPFEDRGNHTHEGWTGTIQINVYYRAPGRGDLPVQNIQAEIDRLLHSQQLCFDGWNIIVFRRQLVDIIKEDDNVTLHGVQVFNLMLGEV